MWFGLVEDSDANEEMCQSLSNTMHYLVIMSAMVIGASNSLSPNRLIHTTSYRPGSFAFFLELSSNALICAAFVFIYLLYFLHFSLSVDIVGVSCSILCWFSFLFYIPTV